MTRFVVICDRVLRQFYRTPCLSQKLSQCFGQRCLVTRGSGGSCDSLCSNNPVLSMTRLLDSSHCLFVTALQIFSEAIRPLLALQEGSSTDCSRCKMRFRVENAVVIHKFHPTVHLPMKILACPQATHCFTRGRQEGNKINKSITLIKVCEVDMPWEKHRV